MRQSHAVKLAAATEVEAVAEVVARAIELSKSKYCSASIMLGETAKITHDFEIVEAA